MFQNESIHNIGASNERLCTYFYIDSTTSSILQAKYKAKIRKTISILRLIPPQKKNTAYRKVRKTFSASSTRTNTLIWKYVNVQIL